MERDDLLARLRGVEWDDFEVKAAQAGIPNDAYKTVSAFANTSGGWLVLGVVEKAAHFDLAGVGDADAMQNDFITSCRSAEKFSRPVDLRPKLYEIGGKRVLAFYIGPVSRFEKPLKVKVGKQWQTYIRKGSGDHRCTEEEEARFLRDASAETFDSTICEDATFADLDLGSLEWYRGHISRREPVRAYPGLDPAAYLHEIGLLRGSGDLTHAAVLMFGREGLLARIKPGGLVDFRLFHSPCTDDAPESRWDDRELCERNLVTTLQALFERLFRLVPQPFALDGRSGERAAESPDHRVVREALVNLLIHQDYSDRHRTARILWFQDRTIFENPGDSYAGLAEMLDGGSSHSRNPLLVRLLRQAGFAEQAGSGILQIVRAWRHARRVPPQIENDPGRKIYRLTLCWKPIATRRDEAWYLRLGAEVSEDAGRLLTFSRVHGAIDTTRARLVTGLSGRDVHTVIAQLITQQFLVVESNNGGVVYRLSPQLVSLWANTPVPEEPAPQSPEGVTEVQSEGVSEGVNGGVKVRRDLLERLIREKPGLRVPQLEEASGLPRSSVERYLSWLRRNGRIEFRGSPRTGGYFPISPQPKRGRKNP